MRERFERFDKYMRLKGLNDNQVTQQCSLSQGLLGQARTGKSDLGPSSINKILKIYQDLNKVWLLTGEGPMLTSDMSGSVHQHSSGDNFPNVNGSGNVVGGVGGGAVEDMAMALRKALGTIETQSSTISTLTEIVRDLRKQIEEQTKKG